MAMPAVRAWILTFVAGCWSTASAPPPPLSHRTEPAAAPASIAGTYRTTHEVMMVCDTGQEGWCAEEGEDTLTIEDRPDGAIEISVELVRTNAHTCSFSGTLHPAPAPANHVRRWIHEVGQQGERDGSDELDESYCKLELEHAASKLTLRSDGCREWCGVRASLDGEFPAQPERPRARS